MPGIKSSLGNEVGEDDGGGDGVGKGNLVWHCSPGDDAAQLIGLQFTAATQWETGWGVQLGKLVIK